ncbi:hypothetical protein PG996_000165 [Apiospora saccharicola]|uniref:Polyketide synthase n=1 Tax=Apiospora saccharicola TaxID=335842 RepID=A0ABR1WCZ7_9PEZI
MEPQVNSGGSAFRDRNGGNAAPILQEPREEAPSGTWLRNGAYDGSQGDCEPTPGAAPSTASAAIPTALNYVQTPIAVIGMSCRLPGHIMTPKSFWDFMIASRVASNEPPESRFSLAGHYDGSHKPYTMKTPGAMFMDVDPSDFDAGFFGVNHMDASSMDPQQRQLMEVAYECLENAGIPLEKLSGARVGCLVGANTVDYYDMTCRDPEDRTESPTMGSNRALLSNRISHFLDVQGPSISLDTACSSTLIALDMACLYLTTNQCDMMIVGGANMYLSPERNEDMGAMRPTASPSGRCHTFDSKADGYVAAEAINCVLLQRVDDAVRDKNPIRAVIRGTSTNSAGRTPGIAMPSATAQAAAIRSAYRNAGISDLSETGFLECHGTGTLVGDPIEVSGAASVFAPSRDHRDHPMVIGSVKSNIGHSEGAAGLSGLIKTVLALEKGIIPGTATFLTPNPKIDFQGSRVRASRTAVPWPSRGKRRASINSFGFGGANAHAIVEDPRYMLPDRSPTHASSYVETDDIGDSFFDFEEPILPPSPASNDDESLRAGINALSSHLLNPAVSVTLRDLAYTLSERRSQLYHRAYSTQRSLSGPGIKISPDAFEICARAGSNPPVVGFVFTGQGAQWPQMGKSLLEAFPVARDTVEELDAALQTLSQPPRWSLVEELTAPRSAAAFREPEFSQPLVTALQLAYLAVLSAWGIRARAVVGHSSGEIAAAAYCGHMTASEAIKIAYLRGRAVQDRPSQAPLGMLAVGSGVDDLVGPLQGFEHVVQAACFNSPRSVTLSGPTVALEEVKERLDASGVFARMLLVNSAYHSQHMRAVGERYMELMKEAIPEPTPLSQREPDQAVMFSSVTAKMLMTTQSGGHDYWHSNMVSPVRFQQAVSAMLQSRADGEEAIDFLVEIGPSNALAGPISQICQHLAPVLGAPPTYSSVSKRLPESLESLYETAARLFGSGYPVHLDKVNEYYGRDSEQAEDPRILVDLPNYAWNHSKKYWHESLASKDWRYRPFVRHDLLGSKILGTPWHTPIFRNRLRLKDNPWLRDHKLGDQVVFPGAAYVAMAMEAMYQHLYMTAWARGAEVPERFQYRLEDIRFSRALVLDDADDYSMISLSLSAIPGSVGSWYVFRVSSLKSPVGLKGEDIWHTHATGRIRTETALDAPAAAAATPDMIAPLRNPVPARTWYKSMRDSGFNFGPSFQKHVAMEYTAGERKGRSTVDLVPPEATFRQSEYVLHPACMDGCFQTVTSSVWQGDRSAVNAALVPFQIDSLAIPHRRRSPGEMPAEDEKTGIANASSEYVGVGRRDVMKHYASSCQVYHPETGSLLLDMRGLRYTELDSAKESTLDHTYAQVVWDVDIDSLTEVTFAKVVAEEAPRERRSTTTTTTSTTISSAAAQRIINLAAHKMPGLSVCEIALDPADTSSLWLEDSRPVRSAASKYRFFASDAHCVVATREAYAANTACLNSADVDFSMLDLAGLGLPTEPPTVDKFHLIIIKTALGTASQADQSTLLANIQSWLSDEGCWVLLVAPSGDENSPAPAATARPSVFDTVLCSAGLELAYYRPSVSVDGDPRPNGMMAAKEESTETVYLVRFNDAVDDSSSHIEQALRDALPCTTRLVPATDAFALGAGSRVLWLMLQHLVQSSCSLLWVTAGAQGPSGITHPSRALVTGLFRVIRNEEPLLNLVNLDVEYEPHRHKSAVSSIVACLSLLRRPRGAAKPTSASAGRDQEYACRQGLLQISRVRPDLALNQAKEEEFCGRPAEPVADLHASSSVIRLHAEKVGHIDSLHYNAVASDGPGPGPVPLRKNEVEIQVLASGVNFKEVAVTIGIVPENEFLLGGEGAGVITRVAADVTRFVPGQRVAFFEKGAFANRVVTKTEAVVGLEDHHDLTWVDAATIPCVFLTSYYALVHLARVRPGDTVLVHSAAGGVGNAAIQLCQQHLGATVYATVGTPEKRRFLRETFGLPDERIFSSRTPGFGARIRQHTAGRGVDVVLNSLTGRLLDESWRLVADGGVLVEIGKRDILDRHSLSMEPFNRNASFRALDLSHKEISDEMIASLLKAVFDLVKAGTLRPIAPVQVFPFSDIPSAFRLLRTGRHIGKLVISNEPASSATTTTAAAAVPGPISVRPAPRLAIYLAQMGARYLTVMSRSGDANVPSKILDDICALGCDLQVCQGDVSREEDVRRVFRGTRAPVAGIVQGAMVLRDRTFAAMTVEEYHDVLRCKVQGTWNLHAVSAELGLSLDFFTLLSSISGLCGSKGQANYAAANAFLDAFAAYRSGGGGRPGPAAAAAHRDVGYMAEHEDLQHRYDRQVWHPINERLLRKIFGFSIMQQQQQDAAHHHDHHQPPINPSSAAQMVTGIRVPQPVSSSSPLQSDARFSYLFAGPPDGIKHGTGGGRGRGWGRHHQQQQQQQHDEGTDRSIRAIPVMVQAKAEPRAVLDATAAALGGYLSRSLRLAPGQLNPGRPLGAYGIDSLAAVEFRNHVRAELGVELSTLEVVNAASLVGICEVVISRLAAATTAAAAAVGAK